MNAIHLKLGQIHHLQLPCPGSAGYRWDFALEEGVNVVDVKRESPQEPSEGDLNPRTSSVDALFSIRARALGRARVHLVLQRPWLINKVPPLREEVVEITVE
ncbi:MAG TPA: protease inhibitor I42 family protein [Candidatus Acidoferrales bacterium]|nr:protease inhibitor I42 family protein [Candidatus Acidoferrales bacterium]